MIQGQQQGWSVECTLVCDNLDCEGSDSSLQPLTYSSPRKEGKTFVINSALVLAMRATGKGLSAAKTLSAVLNLPKPLHHSNWASHTKEWCAVAGETVQKSFTAAADRAKEAMEKDSPGEEIEVPVSMDGTWKSRNQSRHGFVAAVSVETGQVIDSHYMCSTCPSCKLWEGKDKDSVEYLEWYSKHGLDCPMNHEGSAQSMETEGVLTLYNRSIETHDLMYNPFIGDGDSKSFRQVCAQKPYGDKVEYLKEECIGHVQKRMGTRLRRVIEKTKGIKLADGKGLQGPGRLTLARVDAMQGFYGEAIRQNKGNPEAMSRCTLAILKHYSDPPDHSCCPVGAESWCKWQSDQVTGHNTYKVIENPLPKAVVDHIQHLFNDLSNIELLRHCSSCLTQNANESLHHVLWSLVPKDQHNSPQEIQLALDMGVLFFNNGRYQALTSLCQANGVSLTETSKDILRMLDNKRIYNEQYVNKVEIKKKRKESRGNKLRRLDAFRKKEGPQYCSQSFHSGSKLKQQRLCKTCKQPMKGHPKGKCQIKDLIVL